MEKQNKEKQDINAKDQQTYINYNEPKQSQSKLLSTNYFFCCESQFYFIVIKILHHLLFIAVDVCGLYYKYIKLLSEQH